MWDDNGCMDKYLDAGCAGDTVTVSIFIITGPIQRIQVWLSVRLTN